ncbi:MAG TPA: glycogen debranching N-terminal domain-containing protein [Candidatus Angelobacter sp.]|nr:glycogen debranching N-terminal domain-containing protein [Candidatus Angelobacter sp.]
MSTRSAKTTVPRSVARAIVIKHEDIFFLAEHDGGIPTGNQDGFGLYFHDCRYLDGYEIRIAGTEPNALVSTSHRGSIAEFELTNEKLQMPDGRSVAEQTFGIGLQRVIDSAGRAVHDVFTIENYAVESHELPLSFCFHSSFEDIFVIRGLHTKKVGRENKPQCQDGVLVLSYNGADGVDRRLEVHPDPKPNHTTDAGLEYVLKLAPGDRKQIKFSLRLIEASDNKPQSHQHASDPQPLADAIDQGSSQWLAEHADVRSDNPLLNSVMRRCLLDLLVLKGSLDGRSFFSAGLPWYGTLFGRDSIIAALQTLAFHPSVAEQTIRLLAKYQGDKEDEWRDEQPGKILHELRRGELANLNEIPQTPYYGSVDSTPLFLILLGEYVNWTGDLNLFNNVRSNVERALKWIDDFGTDPQLGYLAYASKSSKGLGNQGWKDSGDSIMNADGSLATPPIALVEVQGYVYRAKLLIADLYAHSGDDRSAARLRQQAGDLKERFNHDFWDADKSFYAIALQKGGRPADVISSNPGQALWTGIVDQNRVETLVRRLTAGDMFSGWGIRTLSHHEKRYNPIGYHLGTVWPHDNSIIGAGFSRHGFTDEAARVLDGVLQAARHFEHNRLPEVFAGFTRSEFAIPVRYPVACHPQAWAAGSVPFLLTALLGLEADAFTNQLRVLRPVLPNGVTELEFRRIKIGSDSVDLHFKRMRDGGVGVDVATQGRIQVEVVEQVQPKAA